MRLPVRPACGVIPPEHVETAGHLGITPDWAVNYHCDSEGTCLNYEVVWQAVAAVRCSVPLAETALMVGFPLPNETVYPKTTKPIERRKPHVL